MACVLSLLAKTDTAFKAFLDAQNPRQQHSSTLESYLIKPIQRVLKYPLLLRELFALTDADSEEHYHLDGEHALDTTRTCAHTLTCVHSHSHTYTHTPDTPVPV